MARYVQGKGVVITFFHLLVRLRPFVFIGYLYGFFKQKGISIRMRKGALLTDSRREVTIPMSNKISVVIVTHNRNKDCIEVINSVLMQKEPPYEIIVIDDASPDPSQFKNSKVKIIFKKGLVVYHKIHPNRLTMHYLLRRIWYDSVSECMMYSISEYPRKALGSVK